MTTNAEFWREQLDMARKLPDTDLARHASVSTRNAHTCKQCFCCACEAVRRERLVAGIKPHMWRGTINGV